MAGVGEVILLNQAGYIAECSGDNIILVKNGVLKTPAAHIGILEGVTRNELIEIVKDLESYISKLIFSN